MESNSKWKPAFFIFVFILLGAVAFIGDTTAVSAQEEEEEGYVPPPPPGKPFPSGVILVGVAFAILVITVILFVLGVRI